MGKPKREKVRRKPPRKSAAAAPSSNRRAAKQQQPAARAAARPAGGAPAAVTQMRSQLEVLKRQLSEAQETLDAIRNGEVDALVVAGPNGNQIYSLEGAEQPYRVYVERMQEGAVTVSASTGTVLYANRRFAEMLGLPLEQVIGSQLTDHVAPGDRELLAATLALHRAAKAECTLVPPDRDPLPVQFTASPLPGGGGVGGGGGGGGGIGAGDHGGITGNGDAPAGGPIACLVVTDLTDQKEKVALRVAKEAAEATSVAKDNFLAALSHELRTPLNPALMAAQSLERDPELPERLRDDVAMIRRNIDLEARLIDDLLDLTRIARGKLELQARLVDVHAELVNAIDICRADLDARDLRLVTDLRAARHTVVADPVRIQQAFWNVIRNAVKFTAPGGRIDVRTRSEDRGATAGGDVVRVEVQDTGIGISPESKARLFRPFEQADRSITRRYGGLGLGLAITKAIVDQHAGRVSVESDGVGKGATFAIELKTVAAPTAAAPAGTATPGARAPAAAAAAAAADPASPDARVLNILLVEDHDDTRRSMTLLLRRRFHHDVCAVGNAGDAIKAAGERPFDLVISDLGLPDRSGLELMRELRDRYRLRGICLSGYGMEDDIARSKAAGFDHHLIKPINLERLESLIRDFDKPEPAKV